VNLALGAKHEDVREGGKVPAVPGWVGGNSDKKYSSRILDDGAVDADSVVDLDDGSSQMSEQKSRTAAAAAAAKASPPGGADKQSYSATSAAATATSNGGGGKNARKHHIVCQLIGCGKKSAWALAGVSGVLALVGFTIGLVTCLYKRRRRGFFYGRVPIDDDL